MVPFDFWTGPFDAENTPVILQSVRTLEGVSMAKSQRRFLAATILLAAIPAMSASAFARGTCHGYISNCIKISGQPDAPARCKAAAEDCMKTGVFVGPYTSKTFPADKVKNASEAPQLAASFMK